MLMWLEQLVDILTDHIDKSAVACVAYDTAWVARLPDPQDPRRPAFPAALAWLQQHQLPDGGWGAHAPYHHDRLLSTLAACIALRLWADDIPGASAQQVCAQIDRGLAAIAGYIAGLQNDAYDTVGFELILPELLGEGRMVGFELPDSVTDHYRAIRKAKLSSIPPEILYSPRVPTMFSMEALGNGVDLARAAALQGPNGSIISSPSATAFYLMQEPGYQPGWEYLRRLSSRHGGGVPAIEPIDVFEPAWVLYNTALAHPRPESLAALAPHLVERLRAAWGPEGVATNSQYLPPDLDDSAVTFHAMQLLGIQLEATPFLSYEEDDHFRCYRFERDPMIAAHVHLLAALNESPRALVSGHGYNGSRADVHAPGPQLKGETDRARALGKTLGFLQRTRTAGTFWFEKYHASPIYVTAHAVLAAHRHQHKLVEDAIFWIANSQNPNGSWGFFGPEGSAEETAYCLQALALYQRAHGVGTIALDRGIFDRAAAYLMSSPERQTLSYQPLWIGKTLYAPTYVVHSAVLSALALYETLRGGSG